MKTTALMLTMALAASTAPAAGDTKLLAADGTQAWAKWQGRVSIGTAADWRPALGIQDPAVYRPSSLSLFGDYYLSRSFTRAANAGGMRATGGVILGPRSLALAGLPGAGTGGSFSIGSRLLGAVPMPYSNDNVGDTAALPYLGLGYTGLSARSGWSFSADLGLIAQSPGSVLRLGRGQSLDDVVRELRLEPVLQFGVSYSF